uniref:Uncharacterized protein n=1 Tax=Chromera velia CCMP2878 TaxID=1169474 RepID=A0A0G4H5L1_9ALVE|eukprot:Cvel_24723.t1-p1 / transcript=Cvel_24723.t1 / gene=Cvel_24723 / organism=Chromera_velia_CCMP2878 / gene_product=hypothetical protein / transcript_product=hypothetical protein / location=Cvel_scaffold2713:9920-10777(-) / protein_length=286 / sequence_SO=supercontig / SO=protein_coding / is_pseudo=false
MVDRTSHTSRSVAWGADTHQRYQMSFKQQQAAMRQAKSAEERYERYSSSVMINGLMSALLLTMVAPPDGTVIETSDDTVWGDAAESGVHVYGFLMAFAAYASILTIFVSMFLMQQLNQILFDEVEKYVELEGGIMFFVAMAFTTTAQYIFFLAHAIQVSLLYAPWVGWTTLVAFPATLLVVEVLKFIRRRAVSPRDRLMQKHMSLKESFRKELQQHMLETKMDNPVRSEFVEEHLDKLAEAHLLPDQLDELSLETLVEHLGIPVGDAIRFLHKRSYSSLGTHAVTG